MDHIIFKEGSTKFKLAILVPPTALDKQEIIDKYLQHIDIPLDQVIAFTLDMGNTKKPNAKTIEAHLTLLSSVLKKIEVTHILVAQKEYAAKLLKVAPAAVKVGYTHKGVFSGYETITTTFCPNYKALFFNPSLITEIKLSLKALNNSIHNKPNLLGIGLLKNTRHLTNTKDIQTELAKLHSHKLITCDIETKSLKFYNTNIETIAFATSPTTSITFSVYKQGTPDKVTRLRLLREFFKKHNNTIIYHGGTFDIKILCNSLYMQDLLDYKGMNDGIQTLTKNIEDTHLISYVCLNSTVRPNLTLKHLAYEFAGNYALDVTDTLEIPTDKLLDYNAIDAMATYHVYNKYKATVAKDEQTQAYNLLIDSIPMLVKTELTGMPIDLGKVHALSNTLDATSIALTEELMHNKYVVEAVKLLREYESVACHKKWKVKTAPIEHFNYITFNPNSDKHVATLLYNVMKLPVVDTTPAKAPSVSNNTVKKLKNHTTNPIIIKTLETYAEYAGIQTIRTNFIKAFLNNSVTKPDGIAYLFGSFNIGRVVSGRMSSSDPNMQNIPSHSKYGKAIKECFIAPPGYIMVGADYSSLEDRISALTTKDSNKLKVYTDNYDGHCLRAYSYFKEQMSGITDTVESINSIEKLYPDFRQQSKGPTFALTYAGTYRTLMNRLGFTRDTAKSIEASYIELYQESIDWVKSKLNQASKDGYVTCAFGLRVRTPLLVQTTLGTRSTPYKAEKEARTAGNALGQSYGLLNNRAAVEVHTETLNSPYALDIHPIAHIHDAMYFFIKEDLECLLWFKSTIEHAMSWQELEEIKHDTVKLSGSLEIFYPTWANTIRLPKSLDKTIITTAIKEAQNLE